MAYQLLELGNYILPMIKKLCQFHRLIMEASRGGCLEQSQDLFCVPVNHFPLYIIIRSAHCILFGWVHDTAALLRADTEKQI